MASQSSRIDQLLHLWEDYHHLLSRHIRLHEALGLPVAHALSGPNLSAGIFRAWLASGPEEFDWDNFYPGEGEEPSRIAMTPHGVWHWATESKRVYHLQEDWSALVEDRSSDHLPLDQQHWPFHSFMITLDQPFVVESTLGVTIDCLLVSISRYDDGDVWMVVHLLPKSLGSYKPLSKEERNSWQGPRFKLSELHATTSSLRRELRRYAESLRARNDINNQLLENVRGQMRRYLRLPFNLTQETLASIESGSHEILARSIRLISGLCRRVTHGSVTITPRNPVAVSSLAPEAVINNADVCDVSGSYQFQPGVLRSGTSGGKTGRTVKPHPRAGFMRRPRGSAPGAPKTIKVSATYVHKELRHLVGLPDGTQVDVDVTSKD